MKARETTRTEVPLEQPSSVDPSAQVGAERTDRQALLMAAVVFSITFAAWGSAQFACNRRPPQYKDPSVATTEQLASTPKDAAIEFRQRELTGNLVGALELTQGAASEDLKPKVEQCNAAPGSCPPVAKDTVFTKAELVRFDGQAAIVNATSVVSGQSQSVVLRLERSGAIWKVAGQEKAPE